MAEFCWTRRFRLTDRELSFIRTMSNWRGEPTEKQKNWLLDIFTRLNEGSAK
jgi:hypothetical protein